jgi:predicted DNA-binding transcriptional regulator AlpA
VTTTDTRTWTLTDIAAELGLAHSTLSSYHARGQMPPPTGKLGRTPYWVGPDIEPWIASRPARVVREVPRAPVYRVELRNPIDGNLTDGLWRPLRTAADDDAPREWDTKGAADRARQRYAKANGYEPTHLRTREVVR